MALSRIFVAPKNGQGGVKKSIFFSEKIFERWEKNFGTSGTIFAKNRFFEIRGSGGGQGGSVPRLPLQARVVSVDLGSTVMTIK